MEDGIWVPLFSFYLNTSQINMTIHYTCMKKWILPKIRALMTLKARMTGKMVGIIMGSGTGAGSVTRHVLVLVINSVTV